MYIEKNLAAGEQVMFRPTYHWVRYFASYLLLGLGVAGLVGIVIPSGPAAPVAFMVGLAVLGLGVLVWIGQHLQTRFDEFAVTDRRILKKTGFFSREVWQCPVDRVQNVTVRQSLLGQALGFGTVDVETAGEGGEASSDAVFERIKNPEGLRTSIWDIYGQARGVGAGRAPDKTVRQRLEELDQLKRDGLVTDAEHTEARSKILAGV